MNSRMIDISSGPARLSVRNRQLVIALDDDMQTVPVEDLAIVMLNHPGISLTGAVLTKFAGKQSSHCTLQSKPDAGQPDSAV